MELIALKEKKRKEEEGRRFPNYKVRCLDKKLRRVKRMIYGNERYLNG